MFQGAFFRDVFSDIMFRNGFIITFKNWFKVIFGKRFGDVIFGKRFGEVIFGKRFGDWIGGINDAILFIKWS